MVKLEELPDNQKNAMLARAAAENAAVTLTVRRQNRWVTFRSRFVIEHEGRVWIEQPRMSGQSDIYDFQKGEEAGLTFRMGHMRYIMSVQVVSEEDYRDKDDRPHLALRLKSVGEMQRNQRRLHERVPMPSGQRIRANIWLGGRDSEPDEPTVGNPVWSGRVIDLSVGGALLRTDREAAEYIQAGDLVGVRVTFGDTEGAAILDAQLRHAQPDNEMAMLGLQFVDTERSEETLTALGLIHAKVEELGEDD
ncbi:MAG: flagellar brake protein [Planctomycetota bacterium]|jgi:hypothetical protein